MGFLGGGTSLVMYDLRTLHCKYVIRSGCNYWGAAAEVNAIGPGIAAKTDAIGFGAVAKVDTTGPREQ